MDPITISWAASIAIIASIVTVTLGVIALIKAIRGTNLPKELESDVKALEADIRIMDQKITELQGKLDGKVGTQIDSLKEQLTEVKTSIGNCQKKLEHLTNTIIQYFSGGNNNGF